MSKSILIAKKFEGECLKTIPAEYSVDQWEKMEPIPREELLRRAAGKTGIILLPPMKVDKELLDAAGPGLKVISTHSVGYDHIDIQECHRRGVKVGYTPNVLTDTMAETAIALTLDTIRRFPEAMHALQTGKWSPSGQSNFWMCGRDIKDSVIGFVGAGRIGEAIMKRLVAFGPSEMLYNTRRRSPELEAQFPVRHVSLTEICAQSDIVIVICSLNDSTVKLIGRKQFAEMKPTAYLINVSRGAVVDQAALCEALKNGQIAGAGLDVMEKEPIQVDDPLMEHIPGKLVLYPHLGSATRSTRNRMLTLAVDNCLAGVEDRPLKTQIL